MCVHMCACVCRTGGNHKHICSRYFTIQCTVKCSFTFKNLSNKVIVKSKSYVLNIGVCLVYSWVSVGTCISSLWVYHTEAAYV